MSPEVDVGGLQACYVIQRTKILMKSLSLINSRRYRKQLVEHLVYARLFGFFSSSFVKGCFSCPGGRLHMWSSLS